jgi:hypothetical protein
MRPEDRKEGQERRPQFDCAFDPDTGDLDERCVRDYLSSTMPLAV